MADNTTLNAGTGGDVIASDDIAGVKYQRVKLSCGADGAATDVPVGGGAEAAALLVTVANDSTGVLSVDDNGSTLSIDDGGGAITVDGTVTANLAAGTNNIGDVDVLSVVPGTGATSLGKAEDAAHSSGDTGVMLLAVRNDAGTALAGTTGDYIPLSTDANGALRVAGSSGTTQYTEDDASAGGESLCLMGAIRRDTAATSAGTDGDYAPVHVDANGNLRVNVSSGGIAGIADDAAFTPGTSEVLPIGFQCDDTAPDSVNEGDIGCPRMSATRSIYVNIRDNAGNERGLNVDASGFIGVTDGGGSLTVDATNLSTNVAQMNGTAVTMGNGASGTGVQRVTIANDSTGVLATVSTVTTVGTLTNITNWGNIVDDAAFTPATTRVLMAGFEADETATDSVDEGDGGAARMTLDRKQIVTNYVHAAAGGATPYKNLDVDETEDDIKTSAGKLYWLHVMNLNASSNRFLKVYNNVAATVVVGTTTPDLTFPIPPNTAGFTINFGSQGLQFSTGICIAATTGIADNDTGAPGANEVVVNAGYA